MDTNQSNKPEVPVVPTNRAQRRARAKGKKSGKATVTVVAGMDADQLRADAVAAFRDLVDADSDLESVQEAHKRAIEGLKGTLQAAAKLVGKGRPWDLWLKQLREDLVAAGVCFDTSKAGSMIRNTLARLRLSGRGTNGKRKTRGEGKAKSHTVAPADLANRLNAATLFAGAAQQHYATAQNVTVAEVLARWGEMAAILNPPKRKAKKSATVKTDHKVPGETATD